MNQHRFNVLDLGSIRLATISAITERISIRPADLLTQVADLQIIPHPLNCVGELAVVVSTLVNNRIIGVKVRQVIFRLVNQLLIETPVATHTQLIHAKIPQSAL